MNNKSNKPSVSVIIPNWNGRHLLEYSLTSLNKQSYKNFEVTVVDNGSVDGSSNFIKTYFPKVKVIKLKKNIGFSPAVNIGIKRTRGDYIFLLNNDTEADNNCLFYLVKSLEENNNISFVAAKMLNYYDRNQIDSAGDYIDAVGHANNIGLGDRDNKKYNEPKYIFLATGGGSLIRREVFNKIGLLDDDYFAYFEDVDFCFRAQLQGFKGWYEPKARIYHIHKATSNKNKRFTEYLEFRNMTMTIIKDFPKDLLLKDFNWLKIIIVNLRTIKYLAEIGYWKEGIRADWYILRHILHIIRKRRVIQSKIKVSNQYIIDNVLPKKVELFRSIKKGFVLE